jgi:hypothetical protein
MRKNAIFDIVFPDASVIAELISSCSLVCCPGLFDILQASTAPTLSQLKSLLTDYHKRWKIYLILLEMSFCRPRVYIGSGTNTRDGVSNRLSQCGGFSSLPRYVAAAIQEGYTITHKGLLL